MITKKDYIAILLRCDKTFNKSYEDLSLEFPETEEELFDEKKEEDSESWFDYDDKKFNWKINIENSKLKYPYKLKEYELIRSEFLNFIEEKYQNYKFYNLNNNTDYVNLTNIENNLDGLYFNTFAKVEDVISRPPIILKNEKGIELIYFFTSTSPKRIHNFRILYDYWVCKKAKIKINSICYFLIKKTGNQKGKLSFKKFIILMKTKTLASGKYKSFVEKNDEALCDVSKTIIPSLERGDILLKKNGLYDKEKFWKDIYRYENITILNNDYNYVNKVCQGIYGPCPYFQQCSKQNLQKEWKALTYSGNVFSGNVEIKSRLKERQNFNINKANLRDYYRFLKDDNKYDILINKTEIKKELSLYRKKIIWFDFETISTPFSVVKKWPLPFWHLPFQCSIIITNNLKQVDEQINLVYDPQKITYENLKEIIDKLYFKDFIYVVYNKSFEVTVLTKMKYLFSMDPNTVNKIDYIIKNIVDLADFFHVKKDKWCLKIKELKGFYSIKIINKYLNKHANWIYDSNNVSNYKDLNNIQNGLEATSTGKGRFYNLIKEQIWLDYTKDLKSYCELDVRMMIYCFKFVLSLLNKDKRNDELKIKWIN